MIMILQAMGVTFSERVLCLTMGLDYFSVISLGVKEHNKLHLERYYVNNLSFYYPNTRSSLSQESTLFGSYISRAAL